MEQNTIEDFWKSKEVLGKLCKHFSNVGKLFQISLDPDKKVKKKLRKQVKLEEI